ncbi:hypothetical protein [Microcoleus sp. FACHB-672]|nr:hypothetical protein [Microcoleus sp. FACHB-672]MBD2039547.1 hypothetical protein [Microcoleus sp. FACHB-672]
MTSYLAILRYLLNNANGKFFAALFDIEKFGDVTGTEGLPAHSALW